MKTRFLSVIRTWVLGMVLAFLTVSRSYVLRMQAGRGGRHAKGGRAKAATAPFRIGSAIISGGRSNAFEICFSIDQSAKRIYSLLS